jgi:non-homologous end joining protein Ku
VAATAAPSGQVRDLLEALRASVEAEKEKPRKESKPSRRRSPESKEQSARMRAKND